MDSLCQSMRFRKSCSGGKIFVRPRKSQKSKFFKMQHKASKQLLEAFEELLGASTVVWSAFECSEKRTKFKISAQNHGRQLDVFGEKHRNSEILSSLWKEFISHRTWDLDGRRLYESPARWTSVDGLPRACKFGFRIECFVSGLERWVPGLDVSIGIG